MTTRENLDALRDVCAADVEILKLRKLAKDLEASAARLSGATDEMEASACSKKAAAEAAAAEVQKIAGEMEAQKAKISDLEAQVIEQQTPQTYQALASVADQARRKLSTIEKELEEAETAREAARIASEEADAALIEAQKAADREKRSLRRDLKKNEEAIRLRTIQRANLSFKVEPELLAKYERVSKSVSGVGLAEMTPGKACSGCHMKLRPQVMVMVSAGALAECPTCHRFIYDPSRVTARPPLPDPVEEAEAKAKAEKSAAREAKKAEKLAAKATAPAEGAGE